MLQTSFDKYQAWYCPQESRGAVHCYGTDMQTSQRYSHCMSLSFKSRSEPYPTRTAGPMVVQIDSVFQ